jgi:hypothetical protein
MMKGGSRALAQHAMQHELAPLLKRMPNCRRGAVLPATAVGTSGAGAAGAAVGGGAAPEGSFATEPGAAGAGLQLSLRLRSPQQLQCGPMITAC